MEDLIQRNSSQSKILQAEKLKTNKPPLLPKPDIYRLNSKFQKSVTVNQTSPRKITEETSLNLKKNETTAIDVVIKPSLVLNINNCKTLTPKSPNITSKPHIPPKTVALSSFKSNCASFNPEVSQKSDLYHKQSLKVDKTPLRPPRSPEKNPGKSILNVHAMKKDLLESTAFSNDLILSKEKSANSGGNEDLKWTIKDFVNDSEQLSEFCKQVENCSKHSHILKKRTQSPTLIHRQKKKLYDELDLAFNNNCIKTENFMVPDYLDYSNCKDDLFCNKTTNCINGFQTQKSTRNSSQESAGLDMPKSFVHSYANTCNLTKDLLQRDEKPIDKSINDQSFLHKNKNLKLISKSRKAPFLDQVDTAQIDKDSNIKDSSKSSIDSDRSVNADESKKSENSFGLNSSDVTSFGKRFPWFSSFGKGSKKDFTKKERCFSQFYFSSTVVERQSELQEKKRTKSLPNIKQARVVSNGSIDSNISEVTNNQEILSINSEYPQSDSDDDKDSLNQVELASEKDSKTLAYLKAKELMTSEEVFIGVLKLLNVDFKNYVQLRNFENKNSCIPNNEVNKILKHLPELQSLNEYILEDLKKRIENWENNAKIADVIVKKGAFLKMYTTYIQNFESQTNYLDECIVKYPKFGKIVKDFEATDKCKKLSLKHYMLKPVQRIPQYRLLLNDYLKYLDESSADYLDTLSALKIVCEVVDHANRNLAHDDREGRLMHFQSLLSDFELIKPGRELIKDGHLEKLCRKTIKDRYFILLNDCFLHTTYSKQYLKIHQELPLSGMKICYNFDQKYPASFTVHSITKSFILCAKSEAECKEWVEILQKTIEEFIKKQKTFLNVKIKEDNSFKLGKEAPVWVQDRKVTMCQICTAEFTALFRRHHCRGCGKVVCRNCGSNQAPLQYRNFKPDRVCDQCFELLLKDYEESEDNVCDVLKEILSLNDESAQHEYLSIKAKFIKYTSASNWKKQKYIPPRLKEVPANDSKSVISGWLYRKYRKSWKMFWYVLKDHVLYVYKASEDVLALETIPVLGYELEHAKVNHEDIDKKLIFSLVHPRQAPITFRAESENAAERWFDALTSATNLDYLTF